jgi:hypothetical protein
MMKNKNIINTNIYLYLSNCLSKSFQVIKNF